MIKIDFRTMGNTHQILLLKTRMSIYTIFSNRIEQNIHTRTRTIIWLWWISIKILWKKNRRVLSIYKRNIYILTHPSLSSHILSVLIRNIRYQIESYLNSCKRNFRVKYKITCWYFDSYLININYGKQAHWWAYGTAEYHSLNVQTKNSDLEILHSIG